MHDSQRIFNSTSKCVGIAYNGLIHRLSGIQRSKGCECSPKMANSTCVGAQEDKARWNELTETAVKHIDKILEGLSVEGNETDRRNQEDHLTSRIDQLHHAIFDVRLPELQSEIEAEKKMVCAKQ